MELIKCLYELRFNGDGDVIPTKTPQSGGTFTLNKEHPNWALFAEEPPSRIFNEHKDFCINFPALYKQKYFETV